MPEIVTAMRLLQVGMPADQAQYIHRIGRTARAGKQGQAVLLLHDFEQFFLKTIAELPVQQIKPTPSQVRLTCHHAVIVLIATAGYLCCALVL